MNIEIEELGNSIKVSASQPMFADGELERFDDNIHNIANEFTKMYIKEKDMILSQRLVMKLEEENKKLKEENEVLTKARYSIDRVELEDRIDKAIEYIWSTKYEWGDLEEDNEDFDIDVYKLLDILKGEEK